MLYFLLRPLTRIALKAYFRRITINGLENLPLDQPVLLCSNHPTGFIEPCLLACFLPRTLHFLVRGDLFEKPVLKQILISTNQIPIYRFRDGYEKLRNNEQVMNISYDKLAAGKAILIFPEASTKEVKYLRPIKKGAAHMALETLKRHPDSELTILPIGINYSQPNQWRSYVTINIGEAINPELPEDQNQFRSKSLELTREIESKIKSLLLVKNSGVSDEKLDEALILGQWDLPVNSSILTRVDEPRKFEQERLISEKLVDEDQIPDIYKSEHLDRSIKIVHVIIAIVIILPVGIGLLLNAIPVLFGMFMRNKYVREREFYASVAIAASLGAYLLLIPLVIIVLAFAVGWWSLLLILLPFIGLLSLIGMDFCWRIFDRIKLNRKLGRARAEEMRINGKLALDQIIRKK